MGSGRGAASTMRWTLSTPAFCRKQVNWVLDADIQGFFDAMAHSWIIRFLEHRIADKRILRLIAKWLKVGIVEDGRVTRSERGAPQGAVISPILANVYLHYVFDLWVHRWRRTKATGDVIVIRYADDTIVGFQHEHEAKSVPARSARNGCASSNWPCTRTKTRLIRFGRHAAKQRANAWRGEARDFRLPRLHALLHAITQMGLVRHRAQDDQEADVEPSCRRSRWSCARRMHDPIAKTGAWVRQMLKGHLNYFAVSGNDQSLWWFFNEVRWRWLQVAQAAQPERAFLSWEKFIRLTDRFFPPIRVLHPLPCHRFDARTRGRSPVR